MSDKKTLSIPGSVTIVERVLPEKLDGLSSLSQLQLANNKLDCLPLSCVDLNNLSLLSGVASDYAEPYSEFLPTNYTIDDVKRVVVDQRKRPELGERWKVNEKSLKSFTVSGNNLKFPPLSACRAGVEHLKTFMRNNYVLKFPPLSACRAGVEHLKTFMRNNYVIIMIYPSACVWTCTSILRRYKF